MSGENKKRGQPKQATKRRGGAHAQLFLYILVPRPRPRNICTSIATISRRGVKENQPPLQHIFKEPPIISFKRSKSLNDLLVRAKI